MATKLTISLDTRAAKAHITAYKARVTAAIKEAEAKSHKEIQRLAQAKAYPAERSGQTYVRTGKLKARWKTRFVRMSKTRVIFQLSNRALTKGRRYASYPVGDEDGRQAWMHVGRWWTGLAFYREQTPMRIRNIKSALKREWKRTAR